MKKIVLAAALLASLAAPAWAKNFAFPKNNPAATVTIPDSWTTEAIDYGFSAKSPDGDVFFSVESTSAKGMDKMMELNTSWMKENKIKAKGNSTQRDIELNGMKATLVSMPATDENGDTNVDFVFIPAPNNRIIMLTLWASATELAANKADVQSIQGSIKPIQ